MPRTVELVVAGMCFAAGVGCCAGSRRTMLGGSVSLWSACARYGVGSLANTFLPARAGDAVRRGSQRACAVLAPLRSARGATYWALAGLGRGHPRRADCGRNARGRDVRDLAVTRIAESLELRTAA